MAYYTMRADINKEIWRLSKYGENPKRITLDLENIRYLHPPNILLN